MPYHFLWIFDPGTSEEKAMVSTAAQKQAPGAHDLSEEAVAHLSLAKLLLKHRQTAQREEVRKIAESNRATAEKVAAIRWLEAREAAASRKTVAPPPKLRRGFELPFPLAQAKETLKAPPPTIGLLRYLFRERPRILKQGYQSHILVPSLFMAIPRVDRRLPATLGGRLGEAIGSIGILLDLTIDRGWEHLSKRDYNLIVVFWQLCKVIRAANLRQLSVRDKKLLQRLRTLETLFFFLHGCDGGPELIVESIGKVLALQPDVASGQINAALREVKRILYRDYELPSLFNFLLTLNMLEQRRFLAGGDLLGKSVDGMVDTKVFAASEALQERIGAYVEELKRKAFSLNRIKLQSDRLRLYLRVDASGSPDSTELRTFYDRGLNDSEGTAFLHDRENVVWFIPRFLRLFDRTFAPFLSGKPHLTGIGNVAVFQSDLFGPDLQRLRNVSAKLDHLFFDFRTLSYYKYLEIKAGANIAIPLEREIIHQLEDALEIFLGLAKHLDRLLARADKSPQATPVAHPLDRASLVAPSVLLPYGEARIKSASELNDRSVEGAIQYTVSICYLIAMYLHDNQLTETLAQGDTIQQHLEGVLGVLKRVADEDTYDTVIRFVLTDSLVEESRAESAEPSSRETTLPAKA